MLVFRDLRGVCHPNYLIACNYPASVLCVCSQRKNKQKPAELCCLTTAVILKSNPGTFGLAFCLILSACWGKKNPELVYFWAQPSRTETVDAENTWLGKQPNDKFHPRLLEAAANSILTKMLPFSYLHDFHHLWMNKTSLCLKWWNLPEENNKSVEMWAFFCFIILYLSHLWVR